MADFKPTAQPQHPAWRLVYGKQEQKDLTQDLSLAMVSIVFEDHAEHAASSVEVKLEDRERRWQQSPPKKGDTFALSIGYAGDLTQVGVFQVDEFEFSGPPDIVAIKGISTGITTGMRTPKSRSFENTTATSLAEQIAKEHGLEAATQLADGDLPMSYVAQKQETDVAFLNRVGNERGYNFQVKQVSDERGKMTNHLVMVPRTAAEADAHVAVLSRPADIKSWKFTHISEKQYTQTKVSSFHPEAKSLSEYIQKSDTEVATGDEQRVPIRADSADDAAVKARALQHGNNMLGRQCDLTIIGNPRIRSLTTVMVIGFGPFDGKYFVSDSRHTLTRSKGYELEISARAVT